MGCVAFAGVAAFLSVFDFGNVLVGVGAVVAGFGQFTERVCVSPGAGCAHCVLSVFFGLTVVDGLSGAVDVMLVLVCASATTGENEKAAAAIPASNIERSTNCLPNNLSNKTRDAPFGAVTRELLSGYFAPAKAVTSISTRPFIASALTPSAERAGKRSGLKYST